MATTKKTAKKVSAKARNLSSSQKVGIGVGLTAAAVAAAGAYFLYGSKDAEQNRAKVKSWALKAKGEVLEALEKAENMSKEEYFDLIEQVTGAYSTMKEVSKADMARFQKEMKNHWPAIEEQGKAVMDTATSAAKDSAKKTAKSRVKKVAAGAAKRAKKTTKK